VVEARRGVWFRALVATGQNLSAAHRSSEGLRPNRLYLRFAEDSACAISNSAFRKAVRHLWGAEVPAEMSSGRQAETGRVTGSGERQWLGSVAERVSVRLLAQKHINHLEFLRRRYPQTHPQLCCCSG
jgi:hypothetical protein